LSQVVNFRLSLPPRPRAGGDNNKFWFLGIFKRGFNPRPRAGGDINKHRNSEGPLGFNPRPRAGGDNKLGKRFAADESFNPRPRAGGDSNYEVIIEYLFYVSIHAPARGATATAGDFIEATEVSIHAPARGATRSGYPTRGRLPVSIHAPARGATRGEEPQLPVRGVSIHAPARGATDAVMLADHRLDVSIHAPARGATSARRKWSVPGWFQSTPPRGGRPQGHRRAEVLRRFNPRPRAGGDRRGKPCQGPAEVSIHAPARGATWK